MNSKIALALRSTVSWPLLRRRVLALSRAEFKEAERLERLGQRRVNVLRVFHAIQNERAGHPRAMQRLTVEAKL